MRRVLMFIAKFIAFVFAVLFVAAPPFADLALRTLVEERLQLYFPPLLRPVAIGLGQAAARALIDWYGIAAGGVGLVGAAMMAASLFVRSRQPR